MPRKKISRSALRRLSCDNMIMKKSEIAFLLKNTRFDEQEITEFYRLGKASFTNNQIESFIPL